MQDKSGLQLQWCVQNKFNRLKNKNHKQVEKYVTVVYQHNMSSVNQIKIRLWQGGARSATKNEKSFKEGQKINCVKCDRQAKKNQGRNP